MHVFKSLIATADPSKIHSWMFDGIMHIKMYSQVSSLGLKGPLVGFRNTVLQCNHLP